MITRTDRRDQTRLSLPPVTNSTTLCGFRSGYPRCFGRHLRLLNSHRGFGWLGIDCCTTTPQRNSNKQTHQATCSARDSRPLSLPKIRSASYNPAADERCSQSKGHQVQNAHNPIASSTTWEDEDPIVVGKQRSKIGHDARM